MTGDNYTSRLKQFDNFMRNKEVFKKREDKETAPVLDKFEKDLKEGSKTKLPEMPSNTKSISIIGGTIPNKSIQLSAEERLKDLKARLNVMRNNNKL